MADAPKPDFYVGYLPVPAGLKRHLRFVVPIVLWVIVIIAVAAARSQRDPGAAVWESGEAKQLKGTVLAKPYPMLMTDDRGDGRPGMVLLVEVGKHGGGQRAAAFAGQLVVASGWPLHRDGRFVLEMEPGPGAFRTAEGAAGLEPVVRSLGRITLRGEIIDSKCYLGAMKPGNGKTHKECATLCIAGGIPPMLVTVGADGEKMYYLLAGPDGGPVSESILPLVADPVEVRGEIRQMGDDLRILCVSEIKRL